MNLLGNDTTLKLGAELITLRPTLRCGLLLEAGDGSFAKLIEDLQGGSLTAALFVIRTHHDHMALGARVIDAGLEDVCAALVSFVLQCAGLDPDAKAERNEQGEPDEVSFGEHLAQLYRLGSGWLGWPPQVTLDATPAEIVEAYKGRVDMLKAVFGGGDDATKPKAKATPDQIKDVFRQLGAKPIARRVH